MAEVASAYVTLIPSAKGFASGIQGQIGGQLNRAGMQGGKEFGGGMKSGVAGMASKVFLPLTVALGALGLGKLVADQLGDAITAGSDFQQALGGADAVFKRESKGIKKSADDAALALGLSKTAYLELATVLGAGLKNKGTKDFAKQTKSLIKTGADLAAQFGGTTKDAVEALASALRGETDPIERYGVALNQTAINAKLLADGAKKAKGGQYTEQQKTAARLALITQQTADAQGAFAREADTYAGKQQRLAASWENIKTAVGGALLPALTKLSDWFLSKGLPAIRKFGDWLTTKVWPAIKDGWATVRPAFEQAKKIIMDAFGGESGATMKDFGDFIVQKFLPALAHLVRFELPQIAAGIAAVIEVVQGLWAAFQTLMGIAKSVTTFLLNAFINVNRTAANMLEALSNVPGFGWAKDAADKLNGAADAAEAFKNQINEIPSKRKVEIIAQFSQQGRIRLPDGSNVNVGLRAKGGPVRAGSPYIVGEKGPELVVPRYNGNVIPNHQAGAALGATAGIDYARLASTMAQEMRRATLAVDTRENATKTDLYRNTRSQL